MFGHLVSNRYKKDMAIPETITFDTGSQKEIVNITSLFTCATTGNLIDPAEVFNNFTKSLSRSIIAESYELIKTYCEQTNQMSIFKSWRYYNFNRVIRNCTSHGTGGTLNRWPPELSKSDVTIVKWRHKEVRKSMVGSSVSLLTDPEIVQFAKDQITFIDQKLS